jgi:cardiolipin synthase
LEGPVVLHLQEVFAIDWAFSSGESLDGDKWFPRPTRVGDVWARGIPDGPDEDFEKMQMAILGALTAAQKRIQVVSPYFLPDPPVIAALNVAAMRGIEVEIVLPSQNNIALVQWASTNLYWQLLERGVHIYQTPSPFDHTKLLVVDGIWTLLGSTNWDPRSLRLNFEFNVECYDEVLAGSLHKTIDEKIAAAHEVTIADINSRSFPVQLRDGLARLLSPYL